MKRKNSKSLTVPVLYDAEEGAEPRMGSPEASVASVAPGPFGVAAAGDVGAQGGFVAPGLLLLPSREDFEVPDGGPH